jgi:hypothetical protein
MRVHCVGLVDTFMSGREHEPSGDGVGTLIHCDFTLDQSGEALA